MIALGVVVAAASTMLVLPWLIDELRRLAVIDTPAERSSHATPTPRGGGLAPALGAVVGLVIAVGLSRPQLLAVAGVASAFGALGLADDVRGLPAVRRLVVQAAIAGVGLVPLIVAAPSGLDAAPLVPVVWLWLIGFVNAFNFMDGINGIAAAQVVVAGTAWGLVGLWRDEPDLVAGGFVVAAAGAAFAPFNFPSARVFLGDVGSYFFGGWLAALAFVALGRSATLEMALAPLALFGCDAALTLARRVRRRVRWTDAHREHVYQRLVIAGWSHARTTVYVGAISVACSVLGAATMAGDVTVRVVADVATGALVLGYLATPWLLGRVPGQRPTTRAD